jgi:stage III sporulation protein SpoIIIAA
MTGDEDLDKLLENLPLFIQEHINDHPNKEKLIEIVMDLGRRPEARFSTGPEYLSQKIISWQDLDYTTKRISKFSNENRAGIERTLHRISCIRNRQFLINGLTCRIGRAIFGTISSVRDLLESEQSILLLGKPGVGKTTIIREIARVLSDEMEKRVIIVDTSNEIAGDSDVPHSGIGRARRMQVAKTELQHQIMIEAVENHMPQVIIIDEIGTELEALAARTIAEKGVQLVGTTHGNCLENLIKNPSLSDLIGGIQYVTLSDDEAKRRGTQKSILERKAYPAFQIVIEINEPNSWTIHENVKDSIDLLLKGNFTVAQVRHFFSNSKTKIKYKNFQTNSLSLIKQLGSVKNPIFERKNNWIALNKSQSLQYRSLKSKQLVVYLYSLSSSLIQEVMKKLPFEFILTKNLQDASIILGSRTHLSKNNKLRQLAKQNNILLYSIEPNNILLFIRDIGPEPKFISQD